MKAAQLKPVVRVGQVWKDNDHRFSTLRLIEIKEVTPTHAVGISTHEGKERKVKIKIMRFRPNASGYQLYKDV